MEQASGLDLSAEIVVKEMMEGYLSNPVGRWRFETTKERWSDLWVEVGNELLREDNAIRDCGEFWNGFDEWLSENGYGASATTSS